MTTKTIKAHNLAAGVSYMDDSQLMGVLVANEDRIPLPYADSNHLATIGIGVNLTLGSNMALVLDQLGVFTTYIAQLDSARTAAGLPAATTAQVNQIYRDIVSDFEATVASFPIVGNGVPGTSPSEIALQTALNTKLSAYLGQVASFSVTAPQANTIAREIILGYQIGPYIDNGKQSRLDANIGNTTTHTTIAHDSKEYEALMSLFYGPETLVGSNGNLAKDLIKGDRASAWFEIRYRSNGGNDHGIANRRYRESDLFGLYGDPNAIGYDAVTEAKDIYRMFSVPQQRAKILKYESDFSPTNVNAGSAAIDTQLSQAKTDLITYLGSANQYGNVSKVAASLSIANFSAASIYVATDNATDAIAAADSTNSLFVGAHPILPRAAR
jgi:hypothetical protein